MFKQEQSNALKRAMIEIETMLQKLHGVEVVLDRYAVGEPANRSYYRGSELIASAYWAMAGITVDFYIDHDESWSLLIAHSELSKMMMKLELEAYPKQI